MPVAPRLALIACLVASLPVPPTGGPVYAQARPEAGKEVTVVYAGKLLDVRTGRLQPNTIILIEGERISAIGTNIAVPPGAREIDLRDFVVLPGLIDAHTHVCIQPDYAEVNPILYKSNPDRTVEAVHAARRNLEAGFTTIRDVDSEGADWVDVAVRDGINAGLVPGPRMQVATRALSITGGYMNQQGLAPHIDVPQFGMLTDTDEELIKEIRTEIKYGTDWIKLYATGTTSHVDIETMEPLAQFDFQQIKLVVDEAGRFGIPVAAHAYGGQAARDAVQAGVRSIEHGFLLDDETLELMAERGTYWVPTLAVYMPDAPREAWDERTTAIVQSHERVFRRALEKGVRIAFGTDVGAIPHGSNAVELVLMVDYGMTPLRALQSATIVAAELMQMEEQVGTLEAGKYADIIAVPANPLDDIGVMRQVSFVMKGGEVYKHHAVPGQTAGSTPQR